MKLKFQLPWKFQEALPTPNAVVTRPQVREIGATGHTILGGYLSTVDYNPELAPPLLYDVYDKMRSDGTVKGLMNAIKLPILNVDWRVKPATEDAADVAIAAYIDRSLNNMSTSFESVLYQILLFLDYGSMPLETVWELDADKLITLRKLAPRLPKSVSRWNVDENGGLASISQYAYKSSTFEMVDIPIEKLLVFVNELIGSDYRGTSILRSAYKHWFFKDKLYILDAIAKERRSIGVDVGTLHGNDLTEQDERDLEYALSSLHAHEKQYMIEQAERFTYRIEGIDGRPMSVFDSIEHHDRLILRSMLAEFIALGANGGSFALSKDKSSFFTMVLNGRAKYIADIFNRHLIPRWVNYNWNTKNYPKLEYSRIETRDVEALSNAITQLTEAGYLSPTTVDEQALRDAMELPAVKRLQEVTGKAINGAQLASVTTLFQHVGEGLITSDSARGILKASFPFLTNEQIDEMVGINASVA